MNILYIVPYVPSLVRVRPYHLIRGLNERGHQVTVLTLWTNDEERAELKRLQAELHLVRSAPLTGLRPYWNTLRALPTSKPLQSNYCWQPALAEQIRNTVGEDNGSPGFDIVHVEHLRGARYGLDLKADLVEREAHIPIVWDSVDCISELFRQTSTNGASMFNRIITRFDLPRTRRYESWLLNMFDHVLTTSENDASALRRLNPESAPVSVVPNGVDLSYFTADGMSTRNPSAIVMSGKMSYHANVSMALYFADEVLPHIWAQRRDAQLWIVGKDPPRKVQELARHPQIIVTGTVPDIRPYLRMASVAVAPTSYGVGVQNKVLEAMACGTPVVATPQAVAALEAKHCRELLVAEDASDFAAWVVSVMKDQGIRRSLGRAGRRYVERHHRWPDAVQKLEEIYSELNSQVS